MAETETNDICRGELEISVPWEEVRKEQDLIVKAYRKRIRIPGFRPGKAPDKVIQMRFADEIRGEVVETLVGRHFWKQARAEDYHVVGTPNISQVTLLEEQPLTFKAEFEILPDFELGDYRRLEVPYREPEVADEEISQELERLREQHASYKNLDPRPLEDGDIAVLSLKSGEVKGAPAIDQQETTLTIGAENTLEDFSTALRGRSPGDEVDFEVTYPQDFGNEKLAGKTIPFHAEVTGIRVKELPQLDDDFASEAGDFQNLDELKSRIREEIETHKRRHAVDEAKEKIIDLLVERHQFPVPDQLVEQQITGRLERTARSLAQSGVDPRQLNWQDMREGQRERALRDVRAGLLIERIAEVEAIEADSDEIDAEVQRFAQSNQLTLGTARKQLADDGTLDRIQSHLANEKVMSFLFDEAEKVDPPEQEEPAGETAESDAQSSDEQES